MAGADIAVEAELGAIGGKEDEIGPDEATGIDQVADFVARTGCDMLAVSVGNVRGYAPDARIATSTCGSTCPNFGRCAPWVRVPSFATRAAVSSGTCERASIQIAGELGLPVSTVHAERPRCQLRDLLPDGGLLVPVEVFDGLDRPEPGGADP